MSSRWGFVADIRFRWIRLVLRTPLEELDAKLGHWLESTYNSADEENKRNVLDVMLTTALTLQEKVIEVESSETLTTKVDEK